MNYRVLILRRAQRELAQLPTDAYERVKAVILGLSAECRPLGATKPVGREGWRIRVGSYRVIYEVDGDARTVTVLHVGHRRDVYRFLGSGLAV